MDGAQSCIEVLDDLMHGGLHRCFIEMSICAGGCVGGPVMEKFHRSPVRDHQAVDRSAGAADFTLPQPAPEQLYTERLPLIKERHLPGDRELTEILRQMSSTAAAAATIPAGKRPLRSIRARRRSACACPI